ncbi:nucleotidyltransferase domain-containing protein [Streptomyces rimosus]|uniref:nucleotidyltransferase domain-containing protein n=1 Tax=Streptomyces rimosus TaxID=1927 RepID=UPI00067BE53D|nr:nucleotidyltransferase domain-containing protein [Streptomyces rimosus]
MPKESESTPERTVHPSVEAVAHGFLSHADRLCPGLVEGLYLTGSVALGDYRPGRSDIDYVAVAGHLPSEADLAALKEAHAATRARHRRPYFDGVLVSWSDLAGSSADCPGAARTHMGRFDTGGGFEVNPVTWAVLARHAVPVRGPAPGEFEVAVDKAALREWTLGNLNSYWRRWRIAHGKPLSVRGVWALGGLATAWGVLGVTRLHYTLATGEITSKGGAGHYALRTFGADWHPVLQEALRLHGSVADSAAPHATTARLRNPFARRRAALDYIAMVIDDATAGR